MTRVDVADTPLRGGDHGAHLAAAFDVERRRGPVDLRPDLVGRPLVGTRRVQILRDALCGRGAVGPVVDHNLLAGRRIEVAVLNLKNSFVVPRRNDTVEDVREHAGRELEAVVRLVVGRNVVEEGHGAQCEGHVEHFDARTSHGVVLVLREGHVAAAEVVVGAALVGVDGERVVVGVAHELVLARRRADGSVRDADGGLGARHEDGADLPEVLGRVRRARAIELDESAVLGGGANGEGERGENAHREDRDC
mmetsp:Transcript_12811/g.37375  ORF Transcript_12811/g.37375 Transcript_12811/m.37375 type:complete len:251 (-) Transcript_12811:242-994(-)